MDLDFFIGFLRVPGCPRGGGNWGTLRIPFGKIGEPYKEHWGRGGESPPPLKNPIIFCWEP